MFEVGQLIGFVNFPEPWDELEDCCLWDYWDGEVGIVLEVYDYEEEFLVKWRRKDGSFAPRAFETYSEKFVDMKEILASKKSLTSDL